MADIQTSKSSIACLMIYVDLEPVSFETETRFNELAGTKTVGLRIGEPSVTALAQNEVSANAISDSSLFYQQQQISQLLAVESALTRAFGVAAYTIDADFHSEPLRRCGDATISLQFSEYGDLVTIVVSRTGTDGVSAECSGSSVEEVFDRVLDCLVIEGLADDMFFKDGTKRIKYQPHSRTAVIASPRLN